jgi:hypothetical protein
MVRTIQQAEWNFLIMWEFRVSAENAERFEQDYGPEGIWAQLFQRSSHFVRTELIRDKAQQGRYLTLDFWTSREAYDSFRLSHAAEYEEIDARCEALTDSETKLGSFEPVPAIEES